MVGASVAAPLVSVPAAVLVVAGVAKLRAPSAAGEALRAAGLPSGRRPARAVGAVEALAGAAALAVPSRPALAAAAALYAALAWFALRLLRSSAEVASCGCFGADAPPSRIHALFDAAAALGLAAAALSPPPGVPALAARAPLAGVGLAVACATAAYAMTLVLGHLPQAAAAYRPRREAA